MIPVSEPNLAGNEAKYALDAINSSWISSMGPYLDRFEAMFRNYTGSKHSIALSNGTVAIHLALVALGIKPGDEVIVPNLTYIATANAVTYAGAVPVFADCDEDTWNISLASIERLITPKTRAIIPVHLYGHPCDMDGIAELARKHDLIVIEDAAEAIGSEYRGRKVGVFGDVATFSLYGNKTITTGEGGFVTTNDDELADHMRLLKDQGMSRVQRYWFDVIGYNYRMTNVQAAIGCAQMENVEKFVDRKREIAALYNQSLSDRFTKPVELDYAKNSYWMYSILVPQTIDRGKFLMHLRDKGVDSRPFFHLLSTLPPYQSHRADISDRSRSISVRGLNLPSSTRLTDDQIRFIANIANDFVK